MATEYRVVFAGAVLDGHDLDTVKQTAGHRLKVTHEQLLRLFSGKPVVLKKGLDIAGAEQYVAELNRIGMKVRVEPVPAQGAAPQRVESYAAPAEPAPQAATPFPQLALVDPDESPATPQPTPPALADLANAPTYVIPRNQIEATRQRLEDAIALHDDPAHAPTVIVSPAQAAEARRAAQSAAAAPTLVIPRAGSDGQGSIAVMAEGTEHLRKSPPKIKEAERTLIADEDALNAYLASSGSTGPMGLLDPAEPPLPPVTPPTPPLAPVPSPMPELQQEPVARAVTAPPAIPLPPPVPELPAIPVPPEAVAPFREEPAAVPPPPPLPPGSTTQIRRQLPKTLPQEAAILAARPERDVVPARSAGLTLPIKILLGIVAIGSMAGLGLLIWILVGA